MPINPRWACARASRRASPDGNTRAPPSSGSTGHLSHRLGTRSTSVGARSDRCGRCSGRLGVPSAGVGTPSAGLGMLSAGVGMLSAGVGMLSAGVGVCSQRFGIRSNRVGTKRRGCRGWIKRGVPGGGSPRQRTACLNRSITPCSTFPRPSARFRCRTTKRCSQHGWRAGRFLGRRGQGSCPCRVHHRRAFAKSRCPRPR